MKLVHQQWTLVGTVLVVDDDGNAITLGKNEQGQDVKVVTVNVPVGKFDRDALTCCHGCLEERGSIASRHLVPETQPYI